MDGALHTSEAITALTHENGPAVLTKCFVTTFAILYSKAIHTRCLSAFAVQHRAAIVAKNLVAFVTERILTIDANVF